MHNEFNPINTLDCKPFCDGEEVLRFYDMGEERTNTVTNVSSMKGSGKTEKNTEQAYLR